MQARFVGLVVLASALCLSCGGDPTTSGVPTVSALTGSSSLDGSKPNEASTAQHPALRLAVEQRLADGAYLYTEGAQSFVEVRTLAGVVVAAADAPFDTRRDLLVTDIPAGRYVVTSWQRPNQEDGSPGSDIMDRCERELVLQRDAQVLIVVAPGTGCEFSTEAPVEGPATASAANVQSSIAAPPARGPASTVATSTPPSTDSSSASTSSPGPQATGGVDGPVVFAAASSFGEEALGAGTVELVGDCLMLNDASLVGRRVIVWAFGTSWNESDAWVVLPDGTAVTIGSMISAGGGYHGRDQLGHFLTSPDAIERIGECVEYDSTDNVFVIQHRVEVSP